MVHRPAPGDEIKRRLGEWLLMMWMRQLDPNILGLRRVDEERDGGCRFGCPYRNSLGIPAQASPQESLDVSRRRCKEHGAGQPEFEAPVRRDRTALSD